MRLACNVQISPFAPKGQGHSAQGAGAFTGTRACIRLAQLAHQARGFADGDVRKAHGLQVLVAGLEPIGQGDHFVQGAHVLRQVVRHFGPQVDVHADGPAQGTGRLQNGHDLAGLWRNQQQGAGVQDARCLLLAQQGHDGVHRVVAVGDAFAVKAVARLPVRHLHHRQRGGQAAGAALQLHAVFLQQLGQALAKQVGGQGVEVGHRRAAQRCRAGHVEGAATHQRQQSSVGLGDAVHQGFAQHKNGSGHGGLGGAG